jgi:hypothetical protein
MLKLIRPYLKYSAYHYGLKVATEAVDVKKVISKIEEPWIVSAITQEGYSRLYGAWEAAIKTYLNNQREWNDFPDEFDWTVGDFKTSTARVQSYLHCFNVEISMDGIDKIRDCDGEYFASCEVIIKFWNTLEEYETFRLEPYP